MNMDSTDLPPNALNNQRESSIEPNSNKVPLKHKEDLVGQDHTYRRASSVILVTDDDPMVRFLANQVLTDKSFGVLQAEDGKEALEIFEAKTPDLILCDVMMPYIDGFELCSSIRRREQGKHVPIVMMTGLNDARCIKQAFSIGATDYCEKPVNWELLPYKLDYILRASSAFKELRASEERYSLIARSVNDGLWDWDFKDDQIYFSPRWKSMLGFNEDGINNDPLEWIDRIHPDDKIRLINELHAHKNAETPHFECEYRIKNAEGNYRWMMCRGLAVFDEDGVATRMTGSQTDITDRKQVEEKLALMQSTMP